MAVNLRINQLLAERNMKAGELAAQAGIAYNTALSLVRSPSRVDLSTLDRVCSALGVSIAELFEHVPDPPLTKRNGASTHRRPRARKTARVT